ncbi:Protein bli-3 [Escovopsis weberi]|uniref:Protein bli-3 n=1 Tax=Escovopsis weberi TaxID=150374 RepID=A0A0M8N1N8_ESCWE|nr:Protein bli-3 [Escovopsis weberi]
MSFSNTSTGDKPADPYKETNKDVVDLPTKFHDLIEFITDCKFGMMTTVEATSTKLVSRCMALAATESGGIDLLFHTNTESGKTNDLAANSHVNMAFLDSSGQWASISGTASIVTDRELIKETYTPSLKAWVGDLGDGTHDGSANDPRIGIIRVKMETGVYALVATNFIGRAMEIARGALTGKPAHVNSLREISTAEVAEWRAIHTS